MRKTQPGKQFQIYYKIELEIGVRVTADSIEQALENGKKLGVTDVVDLNGNEHNDSTIRVSGVYEWAS